MQFVFDGKRYVVQIAVRPIMLDGRACQARIDERGFIFISDQVLNSDRRRILLHELRHAWVFARGEAPTGAEHDADYAAEMLDVIMRQYDEQGGDSKLESLVPVPELSSMQQARVGGLAFYSECGNCAGKAAPGSIFNGAPAWSMDVGGWTIERGMLCELCDCVTVWLEACTSGGTPSGTILHNPAPRILRGAESGKWIIAHADTCRCRVLAV